MGNDQLFHNKRKQLNKRAGVGARELRDRFLIVCEGEKTEPNYFKSFPLNADVIKVDVREQYIEKLSELLGLEYKKNETTMYEILKRKQETAIKNAQRLYNTYATCFNPEKNNPSTTASFG
jgi:hypothetical protein